MRATTGRFKENGRLAAVFAGFMLICATSQAIEPTLDIDLRMHTFTMTTTSFIGYGSTVDFSFRVENAGQDRVPDAFRVAIYYGNVSNTNDLTEIYSIPMSNFSGNSISSVRNVTATLPTDVLNGTRYIHFIVDVDSEISESNETNNNSAHAISITGLPDLEVTSLTLNHSREHPGQSLQATWVIRNSGAVRVTDSFLIGTVLSLNDSISLADTQVFSHIIQSLNAGATEQSTAVFDLPTDYPEGLRYVGAIVDTGSTVTESNEINNNSAPVVLTVCTPSLLLPEVATGAGGLGRTHTLTLTNSCDQHNYTFQFKTKLNDAAWTDCMPLPQADGQDGSTEWLDDGGPQRNLDTIQQIYYRALVPYIAPY